MELGLNSRPSAWRAFLATALLASAAVALVGFAVRAFAGAPAPDALVATGVLGIGALSAATLALGCAVFTLTALTRRLGQSWTRAEALATRLVPVVLRRILTVGIGAGVSLGLGTSALADEVDIGWQVTSGAATVSTTVPGPEPAPVSGTTPAPEPPPVADPPADAEPVLPARAVPAGPSTGQAPQPGPAARTVTVRAGDNLWRITEELLGAEASAADVAVAWPRLYEANRDAIGPDPDLIHPGLVLAVPTGVLA